MFRKNGQKTFTLLVCAMGAQYADFLYGPKYFVSEIYIFCNGPIAYNIAENCCIFSIIIPTHPITSSLGVGDVAVNVYSLALYVTLICIICRFYQIFTINGIYFQ